LQAGRQQGIEESLQSRERHGRYAIEQRRRQGLPYWPHCRDAFLADDAQGLVADVVRS
jgi:hypothetical protein